MNTFTIVPSGTYSLRESAEFGFGGRSADRYDGVMRLAFCLDGYRSQVGVELRQDKAGVHGVVHGSNAAELPAVRDQVARVLSLDQDATGFVEVGRRDPVIAALLEVAPGLLPPLFYSPYEAAVWSVISGRLSRWRRCDAGCPRHAGGCSSWPVGSLPLSPPRRSCSRSTSLRD
jgi:DNA-3-methyladenine glycosylase II